MPDEQENVEVCPSQILRMSHPKIKEYSYYDVLIKSFSFTRNNISSRKVTGHNWEWEKERWEKNFNGVLIAVSNP